MNPQETSQLNPKKRVPDTLPVREPGEQEILTIKRHPIGIMGVFIMCGFIILITAVLALVMSPDLFGNTNTRQSILGGTLIFLVVAVACAVFAAITNKVYWSNTWTLTSDSLTQVNQFSLFRRESSQLSLENLEDVTAEQTGVLPRMLNYGVLRVETAGESGKFIFIFCPNPNYYAEQIIKTREAFEQHGRQEAIAYQQKMPVAIDSYEVPGGPDGSV